jgi:hypothetical protein
MVSVVALVTTGGRGTTIIAAVPAVVFAAPGAIPAVIAAVVSTIPTMIPWLIVPITAWTMIGSSAWPTRCSFGLQ